VETLRTFIAFPLPASVRDHIQSIQDGVRAEGFRMRWVKPENIHLTLKFLGNVAPADIGFIAEAMAETVRSAPLIHLGAKGLGVFPGISRPRVLWIGLQGETHSLIEIRKRLNERLGRVGIAPDARPFKAHLTIARAKGNLNSKALAGVMATLGNTDSAPFTAEEMVLYQSELKPDGAVYTRLKSVLLGDDT
jgi:RNA 2',3'-cyclic 3'-phosphodiesterase